MKGGGNYDRIPIRVGNTTIGWLYPIIPSEDPFNTDDYTPIVFYFVENQTKKVR